MPDVVEEPEKEESEEEEQEVWDVKPSSTVFSVGTAHDVLD
jgi:hypothetical protein